MNEIVLWVKQWPDAEVVPIMLSAVDATEANKARRNKFYENFNIQIAFSDDCHANGLARPMKAFQLTPHETWKANICIRDLPEYIGYLRQKDDALTLDASKKARQIEHLNTSLDRAEKNPVKWAARHIGLKVRGLAMPLVLLGIFAIMVLHYVQSI
ncbi:hypothetical protein D3C71_1623550 [compost metagenome]